MWIGSLPEHVIAALTAAVRGSIPGASAESDEPDRRPDMLIAPAAGVFAASPYARARLLRQLHACGLLSDPQPSAAADVVGVAAC